MIKNNNVIKEYTEFHGLIPQSKWACCPKCMALTPQQFVRAGVRLCHVCMNNFRLKTARKAWNKVLAAGIKAAIAKEVKRKQAELKRRSWRVKALKARLQQKPLPAASRRTDETIKRIEAFLLRATQKDLMTIEHMVNRIDSRRRMQPSSKEARAFKAAEFDRWKVGTELQNGSAHGKILNRTKRTITIGWGLNFSGHVQTYTRARILKSVVKRKD